jgi:hypothetical protein
MLLAELGVWLRAEGLSLTVRSKGLGCLASLQDTRLSIWHGWALSIDEALDQAKASYELSKLEPLGPVHVNAQTGEEL